MTEHTALECLECNKVHTDPDQIIECPSCGTNNTQTWTYQDQ